MKKIFITLLLAVAAVVGASAQKFALVDMEYILKQVPNYEMANEQLRQLSQRWQKEVEAKSLEADQMYKKYLADKVFLTEEQVKAQEEAIVAKEKEATDLRYKYFGPEGELYKKRQTLMKPIQDDAARKNMLRSGMARTLSTAFLSSSLKSEAFSISKPVARDMIR